MQQATIITSPARSSLRRRTLSRRGLWLAAVGGAAAAAAGGVEAHRIRSVRRSPPAATIELSSDPAGATIDLDGRARGRTPLALRVTPGVHRVSFRDAGAMATDSTVRADAGHAVRSGATLWRSVPTAQPLRPPFPGTIILGTDFLPDGDVVILAQPRAGGSSSLWRRHTDGSMVRLGPVATPGPSAPRPDGRAIAYLAPTTVAAPDATITTALTALWTAQVDGGAATARYTLSPAQPGEQLADLTWSPDGAHVLLVTHRDGAGGALSRLLWIDPRTGAARSIAELPAAIVPGSLSWGPDGASVALLTQTGPLVSLCLADVRTRAFRYLADLGQRDPTALPYPPIAWSPDGQQVVYTAATRDRATGLGGVLVGEQTVDILYTAGAHAGEGRVLDPKPAAAPVWRDGGDILALARQSGGTVALDQLAPSGRRTPAVGRLPVAPASPYAVRWDAAQARALLVQHDDVGLAGWVLSFEMAGR